MRTDTHRPSVINPDEYQYVAQECFKIEHFSDCAAVLQAREFIRAHMARTGGTYSSHEHGGNCMVCGNANAIYTVLFYHERTNSYVRMGTDCAQKADMGGDFGPNSAFRRAVDDARKAYAGKRKAQALLDDAGVARAWAVYLEYTKGFEMPEGLTRNEQGQYVNLDGSPLSMEQDDALAAGFRQWYASHAEEQTISDIVGAVVKYGDLSEKRAKFLAVLLNKIDTRAERAAQRQAEQEAAAPCPSGRFVIEGMVLSVKVQDSDFGPVTKMLVQHDSGWKVWGTRPSGSNFDRGDRVRFSAAVEVSRDDPKFGFYKRPTKPELLSRPAAEESQVA